MGGRSKKSSGGSVPKATESSTVNMYNNLLGGQLGVIGDALGGMVNHGMQLMENNPGKANFIRAIGGMPIQMDTPDFMQSFIDKQRPKEPAAPAPYNVNDDMRARMGMGTPYGQYSQYGQYNPHRTSMFGGQ